MGYEKVYKVSEIGDFAQRGGIIDVFPINSTTALRFEFLGNKIDNIEKLPIKIIGEKKSKEFLRKKLKSQKAFSDLKNLNPGDYLVHLDHGIARFAEKKSLSISQLPTTDYYVLEYAHGDKLYVPADLERKLSRYVGFSEPKISRLGSPLWQKTKRKIKEDVKKLAKELLEIYAKRTVATRKPCLPNDEIDFQLASSFQYEETPDQLKAMEDIRKDLEKNKPMDRILCGDVGFGKTEVALRAAVKTIKSGWQAVILCPTTILANQHFLGFQKRIKSLPIKIALLSRLQSKKEQLQIIKDIESGKIDFLVGTHRALSKDVVFKNLGLLIIDDEHKFGVKQKEKFKKARAALNILSLSATPIPRTLYLSLSSLRDVSLIKTPPPGRLPVNTIVLPFSKKVIKKAIEKELSRKGQVYYLHNRIGTIEITKKFLQKLLPNASFGIAHGRLREKKIIGIMTDFEQKKIDVLIATTIIESGIDLPNVNTLIVEDGTRLGLAQAHQIRGRVGRSHIKAFAYFLYPPKLFKEKDKELDLKYLPKKDLKRKLKKIKLGRAKIRLDILKESQALGSGYQIALRDLEMRGAGNILGKEQSGNINRIGLNLYCQILSEEVFRQKQKIKK